MLAECSCFIPVLPYSMCGAAKAMGSGCGAAPAHTAPAGFPELSECRFLSVRKGTGSGSLMQSDTPGCLKAQQAAENAVMGGERRGMCPPWGCFRVALGSSKLCSWAEPFPQASGCLRFKLQALNREAFFFSACSLARSKDGGSEDELRCRGFSDRVCSRARRAVCCGVQLTVSLQPPIPPPTPGRPWALWARGAELWWQRAQAASRVFLSSSAGSAGEWSNEILMEQSECFVPKLHINHRHSSGLPEPAGICQTCVLWGRARRCARGPALVLRGPGGSSARRAVP